MNMLRFDDLAAKADCRRFGAWAVLALALLISGLLLAGCLAEEGKPLPAPDQVTWDDVASIILSTSKCNLCHKPNGGNNPSMQYASLIVDTSGTCASGSNMIVSGDRSTSCLYLSMVPGESSFGTMTASALDKETIGLWIDQGAPGP